MKIEVSTHPGLIIINPSVEIHYITDFPSQKSFSPTIILIDEESPKIRIGHTLPPTPYINDTWDDNDVSNYINEYLEQIKIIE